MSSNDIIGSESAEPDGSTTELRDDSALESGDSMETILEAMPSASTAPIVEADARLSYKFQRLREKLRAAITSGELAGRLPGERKLARKFRVNAKTLSKALTDLAAEGLLDRSIGRGTFVKGSTPEPIAPPLEKWLIVCDPEQATSSIVRALLAANAESHCAIGMPPQRPSFLNAFKAVIIFSQSVPDAFIRDLVVRNITVIVVGREPSTYSTHTVMIDSAFAATTVARDLMLAGHRRIAVVTGTQTSPLAAAIRQAASRYAPDASIETIYAADVAAAIAAGSTALVCDSGELATTVAATLEKMQLQVPRNVSLAAIGLGDGEARCSGSYVTTQQLTQSITEILQDTAAKRPITMLLAGRAIDCGTTGPTEAMIDPSARMRYNSVSA